MRDEKLYPAVVTVGRACRAENALKASANPWVVLEGPKPIQLPIENRRHARRFSCDFVRNRLLTRTNGRENGNAVRPVSECEISTKWQRHFVDALRAENALEDMMP